MITLRDELEIIESVKEWKMKRDKIICKKFDTILENIQKIKIESGKIAFGVLKWFTGHAFTEF